jgi:DNA-3-methyladenine glycosylase
VAPLLLGKIVRSTLDGGETAGRIVETEAYTGPQDPASHAAARIGRTARNQAMYGPPGTAYIYLSYGLHWCLNAVTGEEDYPAAVLIRALEPVDGWEVMRGRRDRPDRDLARGPGNLCSALGVEGSLNGHPLDAPPLWIERASGVPARAVARGPRVGISRARDLALRFWIRGNAWVSAGATEAAPEAAGDASSHP